MTDSTFRLLRQPSELRFRRGTLVSRTWLTPDYVRVRLSGTEFNGFNSPGADDHIRLFFPDTGDHSLSLEELRACPSREYTPLDWGPSHLDLEFALHHADSIAGRWAGTAPLGSAIGVGGPRGSLVLDGIPDGWLLAGDETAVPAMRRYAALMPADAVGRILVEVADALRELPIQAPTSVAVSQIHRGNSPAGEGLAQRLDALTSHDRPTGAVFGFIAAEQSIVQHGRALLLDRWGIPADRVIVKGYWKRGEPEYHAPH